MILPTKAVSGSTPISSVVKLRRYSSLTSAPSRTGASGMTTGLGVLGWRVRRLEPCLDVDLPGAFSTAGAAAMLAEASGDASADLSGWSQFGVGSAAA